MRTKFPIAVGLAGLAALGVWIAKRRRAANVASAAEPSVLSIDVDDDTAAEMIARYRPALEAALTPSVA